MRDLSQLCKLIRYYILTSTTEAGSGHPTSSLSAVELMATLFFDGFLRQNTDNFQNPSNDRVIFSKGHASPLLYSLYTAAGVITQKELITLRKFDSRLQGHPTPDLPFVDVATGSLGQGLSMGLGMALGIRLNVTRYMLHVKREPTVWVLLGDSESAEGQVWEAMETASTYNLNNLVGILDINRLGQSGETELSWDLRTYESRIKSFGWETIVVKNGHNLEEVKKAFEQANSLNTEKRQKPLMILARTVKGKGISFLEDKEDWHGKALSQKQLKTALKELGRVNLKLKGEIKKPGIAAATAWPRNDKLESVLHKLTVSAHIQTNQPPTTNYQLQNLVATREAFGQALETLGRTDDKIVVLDAEMGNSTYVNKFGKDYPERFFQMYIDEENMVSVALGLSKAGFIPYLSTFAAFLTRAFDQIRMSQYSFAVGGANVGIPTRAQRERALAGKHERQNLPQTLNIIGSHCGVSIGPDGPSQMGLEDIAMMRAINHSTVLYPSDAVSTAKLTQEMATNPGINYLRTTRGATPVIYDEKEEFPIGRCKIHYPAHVACNMKHVTSKQQMLHVTCYVLHAVIIAAGITLHEALKAQNELAVKNINTIVVDLYSIKPLDVQLINQLVIKTNHVIVVEDHYEAGGMGEAVAQALLVNFKFQISNFKFSHLCVRKTPRSGTPEELLRWEEIDAETIIKTILKSV